MEPEKKKRCGSVVKKEESAAVGKEGELELGSPAAVRAEDVEVKEFYSILRRMHRAASYFNGCDKEKEGGAFRGGKGKGKGWQPSLVMERLAATVDVVAPVGCNGNDLKRKRLQDCREDGDQGGDRLILDLNADPDA